MALALQFVGALGILVPFTLLQLRRTTAHSYTYLAMNVVGAVLLTVLAVVESQWGFVILQGAWALVASRGLLLALTGPRVTTAPGAAGGYGGAMTTRPTQIKYTAEATATGGRAGRAETSDGKIKVDLSPPAEMGGDGEGTNPEQLFATGYAACFQGALGVVGRKAGVDTSQSTVTGKVGIGPNEAGGFGLAVELEVALPGVEGEQARTLVEQAHEVCPYSNATRGNIDVALSVV